MTQPDHTPQEARTNLYEILRSDAPFEEKAQQALDIGREYLGVDNGHLTQIETATNHWEVIVSTDSANGKFSPGLELDIEQTYCRRPIEENAQLTLSDAPNQGWASDPAFETHGVCSYLGTPIIVDGEPFGTACFVAENPREEFSVEETLFAELLARMLERELERKQQEVQLTRQSNLAVVLNRILRHNLRNDLSAIRGYTQLMADKLGDDPFSDKALQNIDKLIDLSEKARHLDRVIANDGESEPTDITEFVENVIHTVRQDYPDATITFASEGDIVTPIQPNLERALEELLDNAVKHTGPDPTVRVSVQAMPNAVEIRIADDGPGLAEHEIEVLETGTETPLTHGSGLGLWLANWVVTSHDGSISATVTDEGTTMTVTLPRGETPGGETELTELRRALDQYDAAFEEAFDAMVIFDDDGQIIAANPEASTIYGPDRDELLGRSIGEFLPEEFEFEAALAEFKDAGEQRDIVTIVGTDGVHRQVEYSATTDIVPGQHLVIGRDITDRVEREAELRRKTEAMETAPVGISLTDPELEDNPLVYVNEQFTEITGYDEEAALGRNCRFLQTEQTDPAKVSTIRHAIETKQPVTVTIRNERTDGTTFWNRLSIAPVRDETGEVMNYVGFQQDVTEQVEREQRLREAETIFEQTQDGMFLIDVMEDEFRVKRVNDSYERLTGLSNENIQGQTPREIVGEEIGAQIEARYTECVEKRRTIQYEESIPVDGEPRQWETKLSPVIEDGTVVSLVGAIRDITDRS